MAKIAFNIYFTVLTFAAFLGLRAEVFAGTQTTVKMEACAYSKQAAPIAEIAAGEKFLLRFEFDVPKGEHIYGQTPSEFGDSTKIELRLPSGFRQIGKTEFPPDKKFSSMGIEYFGYDGRFFAYVNIAAPQKFSAEIIGARHAEFFAKATMIQCGTSCVPVEKELSVKLGINPLSVSVKEQLEPLKDERNAVAKSADNAENPPIDAPSGVWGILFAAFVGGAILNLMPCVFPVIGLKILSFASNAKSSRAKIFANAFFYTLGIVVSFLVLAAVLAALKRAGSDAGWGFQLQNPAFTFFCALLFFAMGLSFAGAFEIGAAISGRAAQLASEAESAADEAAAKNAVDTSTSGWAQALGASVSSQKESVPHAKKYFASFLSGALAVLVASPCTAPFMGSAVGYVLTADVAYWLLFATFAALGLGMAAPYVLISAIPSLSRALPRPGAWMEIFKNILSVPLFASAVWLMWVWSNQTGGAAAFAFAALVLAVGLRIYGMCQMPHYSKFTRIFGVIAAAVSIAAAVCIGIKFSHTRPDGLEKNPKKFAEQFSEYGAQKWSPQTLRSLLKQGNAVYVDFTASWCLTCKFNHTVLESQSVKDAFKKRGVKMLVGDWTNRDNAIKTELEKFGRAGVPLNLLYSPDSETPQVLPAILTPAIVIEAVDKIR